jgi:hypothetical protein
VFDFAVRYDPRVDSPEDLTKRVLFSLFVKPIRMKKPRVIFVSGDSGEGKSYSAIRLQEILCELQGIDVVRHFKDMNVFTPLEYPKKLDRILNDRELRKVNIICMHEAREIIKAKDWHSFLTQSIADVNAMSRSIKRICFIIISQFIRDITSDVRYTLNYYVTLKRNRSETRMFIQRVWKDDRDLEKPKLRKRRIFGYVIYPDGRRKKYMPEYLLVKKPNSVLLDMFDELDTKAKREIIRRKTNKLIEAMEMDLVGENSKIVGMVKWYVEHPEELNSVGKLRGGRFVLEKKFNEMHDLTNKEKLEFVKGLQRELKEKGIINEKVKE